MPSSWKASAPPPDACASACRIFSPLATLNSICWARRVNCCASIGWPSTRARCGSSTSSGASAPRSEAAAGFLAARREWKPAGLVLAGALAAIAPATIRNAAVSGEFTLTTAQLGPNLYTGNNEHNTTGRYGRGDIAIADQSVNHRPIAETERPCISFAVTDAPLRFNGPIGQRLSDILGF